MTPQAGRQIIRTDILPNIPGVIDNQAMKFD